jgi:hypothetical protein
MYSPTLGRWMQMDPAGYVDGANIYEFVKSNPIVGVDPSGLDLLRVEATSDWFDHTPPVIVANTNDFRTTYRIHNGWSRSDLVHAANFNQDGEANGWWINVGRSSCVYRINGFIRTYMHRLVPNWDKNLSKEVTDVVHFQYLAFQHENNVIQALQNVFSPRFTASGVDKQARLDAEFTRRQGEFAKILAQMERTDVPPMRQILDEIVQDGK